MCWNQPCKSYTVLQPCVQPLQQPVAVAVAVRVVAYACDVVMGERSDFAEGDTQHDQSQVFFGA